MLNRVLLRGRSSNKFRHSLLTKSTTTTTTATRCSLIESSSSSSLPYGRRFLSVTAKDSQQQHSSSSSSSSSGGSGNYLIKFGWFLLGVVALDQALQYKQEQEAKQHQAMLRQMQHEANTQNNVDFF